VSSLYSRLSSRHRAHPLTSVQRDVVGGLILTHRRHSRKTMFCKLLKKRYLADEPISRILFAERTVRWFAPKHDQSMRRGDHSSRSRIPPGLQQPTRGSQRLALASKTHTGRASPPLLFGLAPRGVFRAPDVATRAVGSYPTFSPLPNALDRKRRAPGFSEGLPQRCKHHRWSIFCGTFRSRIPCCGTLPAVLNTRTGPLALPGALPRRGRLLRVHHGWSPDFPPARSSCDKQAGDHPAHPPCSIIRSAACPHNCRQVFTLLRLDSPTSLRCGPPGKCEHRTKAGVGGTPPFARPFSETEGTHDASDFKGAYRCVGSFRHEC